MKAFLFLVLVVAASCQSMRFQVVTTKSDTSKSLGSFHVYSNDTISIAYSFWADNGEMSFVIYNKSNRPIYIDWKKSSFIYQGVRQIYWEDKETKVVKGTSASKAGAGKASPFSRFSTVALGFGEFSAVETTKKPERITFIPPKSQFARNSLYELAQSAFSMKDARIETVTLTGYSKKQTKIKVKDFSKDDSPISFRNFITWSTTEDFKEERYVDNVFYVSNVVSMEPNHFWGKVPPLEYHYDPSLQPPFAQPDRFYLKFYSN